MEALAVHRLFMDSLEVRVALRQVVVEAVAAAVHQCSEQVAREPRRR